MTTLVAPKITMNRQWQRCMLRQSKRDLLSDDYVDPAIEKHMTLPTRVSLVPKIDSLGLGGHCGIDLLEDDDDEDDDDDFGDFNDDSSADDHVRLHMKRPATMAGQHDMTGLNTRHRFPDPDEAKETESYDGYQDESIASQQREIYHHRRDASSVMSVHTHASCDITSLKASDSIMQQQLAIMRQIQEENDRGGPTDTSVRQDSGHSYKRQRSNSYSPAFNGPPPQRSASRNTASTSSTLQGSTFPFPEDAVLAPPTLQHSATANLAMFLQGRQAQIISKSRVDEATKKGLAIKVVCVGCGEELMTAKDMAMVYCSSCGTLAPLDLAVIATKS